MFNFLEKNLPKIVLAPTTIVMIMYVWIYYLDWLNLFNEK